MSRPRERPRPCLFFFFNDTATTEIYTLSLHDALPIYISDPANPVPYRPRPVPPTYPGDRKSTRLNSSHRCISYAVFCLKKRVLEGVPGHDQAAGESLWRAVPPEKRSTVEAAAMDMSAGFSFFKRSQAPQDPLFPPKRHFPN